MTKLPGRQVLVLLLSTLPVAACTLGGETIVNERAAPLTQGDGGAPSTKSTPAPQTAAASTCSGGTLTKVDVSTLKACGTGGHCYGKDKVPATIAGLFAPCPDASDLCVGDEFLTAGGQKIKQCTQPASVAGTAGPGGGCVSVDFTPELKDQAGKFLSQQECDANQLCVPCKDPSHGNADTPFCKETGVYDQACGAATAAAPQAVDAGPPPMGCCSANGKSAGQCMSNAILPEGQKDSMPQDVCGGTDVCMPVAMLTNKAVSCDAGLLFGKGVCMDACFNGMMAVAGIFHLVHQDICGETELCAPCSTIKANAPPGTPVPGCD